ncbi:MAG: hypothetical protein J0I12_01800 [Candidatus Eremiobacteraeota bacterium]|nr:hypothetical protein [Candidatus Eremiobacteraeota bacterium]
MKTLIALALTAACLHSAAAEPPKQLIDNVMKNPGFFSQNCSGPRPRPFKTMPLYGYKRDWSDSKIAAVNFEKLRAQRLEVTHQVAREIDALNVKKSLQDFSRGEMLLVMVLDLNGVEDLSALLRLESEFDKVAYYRQKNFQMPKQIYGLNPHVQVLSVITAILKNEQAEGLDQLDQNPVYDQATRDRIVRLAKSFVDRVDPKNYRRGAAMSARPENR